MTSTVGGEGCDHLTDIRNVVKSRDDVARVREREPEGVRITSLDLRCLRCAGKCSFAQRWTWEEGRNGKRLE